MCCCGKYSVQVIYRSVLLLFFLHKPESEWWWCPCDGSCRSDVDRCREQGCQSAGWSPWPVMQSVTDILIHTQKWPFPLYDVMKIHFRGCINLFLQDKAQKKPLIHYIRKSTKHQIFCLHTIHLCNTCVCGTNIFDQNYVSKICCLITSKTASMYNHQIHDSSTSVTLIDGNIQDFIIGECIIHSHIKAISH